MGDAGADNDDAWIIRAIVLHELERVKEEDIAGQGWGSRGDGGLTLRGHGRLS
jgi:hypothetical protein